MYMLLAVYHFSCLQKIIKIAEKSQHVKMALHSNYCTSSDKMQERLGIWLLLSKCVVGYILWVEYVTG